MRMYRCEQIIDGERTFPVPLPAILGQVEVGGGLGVFSPAQYITERQRNWWKGILLPALSADDGRTKSWWEGHLKLIVMPDQFRADALVIGGNTFHSIPSITKLSKNQMSDLIEGSVEQAHAEGFAWVTLPDPELRR